MMGSDMMTVVGPRDYWSKKAKLSGEEADFVEGHKTFCYIEIIVTMLALLAAMVFSVYWLQEQ